MGINAVTATPYEKGKYFVISSDEDGISIEQVGEATLLSKITPNKDGYTHYGRDISFLDKLPNQDKGYFLEEEGAILIIRGEIVVPTKKEVVTIYELPGGDG